MATLYALVQLWAGRQRFCRGGGQGADGRVREATTATKKDPIKVFFFYIHKIVSIGYITGVVGGYLHPVY